MAEENKKKVTERLFEIKKDLEKIKNSFILDIKKCEEKNKIRIMTTSLPTGELELSYYANIFDLIES